jgi:hypothetical protein
MKILVACEFSGVVRDAFAARGHDAWSCDLLPSERNGQHIQDDVLKHLHDGWDLLIAHPPCTCLCNSGVRWLAPKGMLNAVRHHKMMDACDFFAALYHAPCQFICVENPILHKYAKDYLDSAWEIRLPPQRIQPWQFGHGETKMTCLWLRGLPPLCPTHIVAGRIGRVWKESPSCDRWKNRSRTYEGIAKAMAEQWG